MVKFLFQGQEIYMDGYLDNAANEIITQLNKDNDALIIVDGSVGSGKSTLAQQLAARVDPTFSVDRACFDADEFKKAIINAGKKQAIIFDEALNGLNIRRTMSAINVTMTSLLTEIRQKNLFIIMCLPSIFDMDKSIAIHRSQCLVHVYLKNGKRGYFRFYGKKAKAKLFGNDFARRTYQYVGRSTFWGKYFSGYVIDEAQYRAKKDMVLKKYLPIDILEKSSITKKIPDRQAEQIFKMYKIAKMSFRKIEELGFGNRTQLAKIVREYEATFGGDRSLYLNTDGLDREELLVKED